MKPVHRSKVNKGKDARKFGRSSSRTAVQNVRAPMRGGWRM